MTQVPPEPPASEPLPGDPSLWNMVSWPEPTSRKRWLVAGLSAGLLVALGAMIAWRSEPSVAEWAAEMALRIHTELDDDHTVTIEPAPSSPPPQPPAPELPTNTPLTPPSVAPPHARLPARAAAKAAPAPGPVAAPALAGAAAPQAPVDFSSVGFVAGSAAGPVSGAASAMGGPGSQGARGAGPGGPATGPEGEAPKGKLARPVTLAENAWDCPWPASADEHERDEARVELSVQVRPNGEAAAVRILHDPGFGFGEAARACAARTTFQSARDNRGQPITAWSPNIRVTFRR